MRKKLQSDDSPAFDFIGDIHGHAAPLRELLEKLGFVEDADAYRHPEGRRVVFLGDYIDRGPAIRETLQIVKDMCDAGTALAIMGNHEFNAICYHTPDGEGGYLRPHSPKKTKQHEATLAAFEGRNEEWHEWLSWFKTLPFYLELDGARAVHATWDPESLKVLETIDLNNEADLRSCATQGPDSTSGLTEYDAIEKVLKGTEIPLPEGDNLKDKYEEERTEIRVKWWDSPTGKTYRQIVFPDNDAVSETSIPSGKATTWSPYCGSEPPVFFGHYWIPASEDPAPQAHNAACLDYSVAADNGGALVAYRWDGESSLNPGNYHSVHSIPQDAVTAASNAS